MMRADRKWWPLAVLLAEVLVFFRQVLFYGHYVIPWDFRSYHFAQIGFMARSLAHGELPLWDPYTYCGFPSYADLTAQLFYPPSLAALLASNWTGGAHVMYWFELQLIGHVWLAGVLTYWLLRRLGVGRAAALAGATVYQLGAYMVSQTQHLGAIDAAAWMPLTWLSVVALAERFTWRWMAALAGALALAILAGFPATTAVVFASAFLLAAILAAARRAPLWLPAGVAIAAAWAALVAAIQLLPTIELSRLSIAQYRSDVMFTGGGMPLQSLVSMVAPNHYGQFQFDSMTWKLPWNVTFLYTYCGIPALLFVALAVAGRRNRYAASFACLTLAMALWMLGGATPVGRAVFALLPKGVKNPLYAEFALCGFSLGMAVLAGLGAEQFLRARGRWMQAAVVAVAAADLIVVGSGRPMNTGDAKVEAGFDYDRFDRYKEIPTELRRLVNQSAPPWRFDVMGASHEFMPAAKMFETPTANGDNPFALVRLMQVRLLFSKGDRWGRYYPVGAPDSPVLKLLNVRYVLSSGRIDPADGLVRIEGLPGTEVYENPAALPRFFLVNRVRAAPDMEAALAILRAPDFDPRAEAVVEGAGPIANPTPGDVRLVEYGARQFVVEVEAPGPAFLATSETAYPGWRAWLDGREQEPALTDVAFRGLSVPAGKHVVKMRFDPPVLRRGAWISLGAVVSLFLPLVRRRAARSRML